MLGVHDIVNTYVKRHSFGPKDEAVDLKNHSFKPSIGVEALDASHSASVKLGVIKDGQLDLEVL